MVAGESRCLDAFAVTLSQACEGGEKRWYTSARALEQVLLEMYVPCLPKRPEPCACVSLRTRPAVSSWFPCRAQGRQVTAGSEVRPSSRVPILRALRLEWNRSMEDLFRSEATELWAWSEFVMLKFKRDVFAGTLESSVVWPTRLQTLHLDIKHLASREHGICAMAAHAPSLHHEGDFDHPAVGVTWPASLQQLTLEGRFNHPLNGL